ncbi:aspartate/glutamate racemase family protein [Vogesella sp. LIG4]|uniref:aspartate/glutamate racemase family protein n=1 Tax=Vogesella sp. LIG4 TaxID=1192162 RepID=UPI00081FCAE5|nr:aspartate/glutamate racemase family protein [Vogesella sp. LIG4]SCK19787.1 aspartate racemase [Vogesella sp. LIG4]
MRYLGLLGGMSWESTLHYYQLINEGVRARLGGLHSAPLLLHSVDFAPVAARQRAGEWQALGTQLAAAAQGLQQAGAGALLLCTNTMHKVAPAIEAAVDVPLLHIADPTIAALQAAGVQRVGLLGTRFTMDEAFYRDRLAAAGLQVLLPDEAGRSEVHRVIFDELCLGRVLPASRTAYQREIAAMQAAGAQAVILGCTEIGMLLGADDSPLPLFDTTALHAAAAVAWLTAGATY